MYNFRNVVVIAGLLSGGNCLINAEQQSTHDKSQCNMPGIYNEQINTALVESALEKLKEKWDEAAPERQEHGSIPLVCHYIVHETDMKGIRKIANDKIERICKGEDLLPQIGYDYGYDYVYERVDSDYQTVEKLVKQMCDENPVYFLSEKDQKSLCIAGATVYQSRHMRFADYTPYLRDVLQKDCFKDAWKAVVTELNKRTAA